jgi:hypothetical protein
MSTNKATEKSGIPRRRWRQALVIALLGIVVLLVLRGHKPPQRPQAAQPDRDPIAAGASLALSALAAAHAAPPKKPAEAAPVIDEIKVEKLEVCEGEENLVSVRAHSPDGDNSFLHYSIDGETGSSVAVKLALSQDGAVAGQHFILVFGRNNVSTILPLPQYRVKPCRPRRVASLQFVVESNAPNTYDFVAHVAPLPPPPTGVEVVGAEGVFVPVSYDWSFGDGETAHTDVPLISHSYERRAQDTLYSDMVASVEIRSRTGEVLVARRSLALLNPAYEARVQKGIVSLQVSLEPRFPHVDEHGRVVQRVRLWHTDPQPVTIQKAMRAVYRSGGAAADSPQAVDVAGLLGTAAIPPGPDGLTTEVVLDTGADSDALSINYDLAGVSTDGMPVLGAFSVMRPPPEPTADNSKPVVDPALKAKILAARQILGKNIVNDEEIAMLERQGRFDGLPVPESAGPPAAGAAPAPPSTPPPTAESAATAPPPSARPSLARSLPPAQAR